MESIEDVKKFFKNAAINTNPKMDEAVLNKVLIAHKKTSNTVSPAIGLNIRRIIMKSRIAKLGVVALVIAISLLLEFGGSGDIGIVSVALARATEALNEITWVHSTSIKMNDKHYKSEFWFNNKSRTIIIRENDGTVVFRDYDKNLRYQYNPQTNEIVVSQVTEDFRKVSPPQWEELSQELANLNYKVDVLQKEDVIDGNSVKVFKVGWVDESGMRSEREYIVDTKSDLPILIHTKRLDSDGSVLSEGRWIFQYPQEGPITIYDVGVPKSAELYNFSEEELETSDVEQSDISESANKLSALGKALFMYANDRSDEYPDTLQDLEGYLDNLQWFTENVEYLGKGKTVTAPPNIPLAYDRTLLEKSSRTNVLRNDSQVIFERPVQR